MENKIEKVVCELSFDMNYNPFIDFSYELGDKVINVHSSCDEICNLPHEANEISDAVLYVNEAVRPIICDKSSGNVISLTDSDKFALERNPDFFKSKNSILFGYKSIRKYGFKSNLDIFYQCMMSIIEASGYYKSHDVLFEFLFNGKKIGDSNMPENEVLEKLSDFFYNYKRNIKKQTPTMLYSDEELEQKGFKLD